MAFRLTEDEAWELVGNAHTGIFTSLRRDGRPIAVPVWFVADDGAVYIRTPSATKQAARIRHDTRAHFLVEQGTDWAELVSVNFEARGSVVDDPKIERRVADLLHAKYAAHQPPTDRLPDAVKQRYAQVTVIKLEPTSRLSSWNNSALL